MFTHIEMMSVNDRAPRLVSSELTWNLNSVIVFGCTFSHKMSQCSSIHSNRLSLKNMAPMPNTNSRADDTIVRKRTII